MEIKINPLAYLKLLMHAKAFANDECFIYGLLTGYVEDEKVYPQDYIPLSHSYQNPIDFELKHEIFGQIDSFNEENYDPNYIYDQVVGWVRSGAPGNNQILESDRKNQEYIQTAYCEYAIALFGPPTFDQYEMTVKKLKGSLPEIDSNSSFEDVDWNFGEIEDIDNLFELVLNLQKSRNEKAPLIEEIMHAPINGVLEGATEKIS